MCAAPFTFGQQQARFLCCRPAGAGGRRGPLRSFFLFSTPPGASSRRHPRPGAPLYFP